MVNVTGIDRSMNEKQMYGKQQERQHNNHKPYLCSRFSFFIVVVVVVGVAFVMPCELMLSLSFILRVIIVVVVVVRFVMRVRKITKMLFTMPDYSSGFTQCTSEQLSTNDSNILCRRHCFYRCLPFFFFIFLLFLFVCHFSSHNILLRRSAEYGKEQKKKKMNE